MAVIAPETSAEPIAWPVAETTTEPSPDTASAVEVPVAEPRAGTSAPPILIPTAAPEARPAAATTEMPTPRAVEVPEADA